MRSIHYFARPMQKSLKECHVKGGCELTGQMLARRYGNHKSTVLTLADERKRVVFTVTTFLDFT